MDVLINNPMALPVLASIVMLLVLASLARHPVPGVVCWLMGCSALVAAQCAYALRGTSSLLVSMVFANAAFLAGMLLLLAGCLRFFGRPVPHRTFLGVVLLMTLYNLGPWFGYDRMDHRVVVFSVAHGAIAAALALIVWRSRPRNRPAYAYGLSAGIAAWLTVGYVARIAYYATLPDPTIADRLDIGVPAIFVTLGVLGNAALIMSLIVMAHDRLLADIESVAYRDHLTGAASRLAFINALDRHLSRPVAHAHPLALLLIDLDHFKAINDAHGHAGGDAALVHFSASVLACLNRGDVLGRLGGEEFAVLLPEASAAEAMALDARLRAVLSRSPALYGRAQLRHGFSSGLAVAQPGDSADRLLARADAALYRAKREGRGRLERAADTLAESRQESALPRNTVELQQE